MTNGIKSNPCILITGAAGFIGSQLSKHLLLLGYQVVGVDNYTPFYDIQIKQRRIQTLSRYKSFIFYECDIVDQPQIAELAHKYSPQAVIHLAAQAGVVCDDSWIPQYIHSNIKGFESIALLCALRHIPLLYASSSSVYGEQDHTPFRESDVPNPTGIYACSKHHNELLAELYRKHLGLQATGLRFFSVYGEGMRPDLVLPRFVQALKSGEEVTLFGSPETARDFTYIGDLIEAIACLLKQLLSLEKLASIYNIGSERPVQIIELLRLLERILGQEAKVCIKPLRPNEMHVTYADSSLLKETINFKPKYTLEDGIKAYIKSLAEEETLTSM